MPDNAHEEIHQLLQLALHLGVEFLDLELYLPENILHSITNSKRNTKIIASHHDPKGTLSWSNGSWVHHYNKGLLYGDIIKLVGIASTQRDNSSLLSFRSWASTAHPKVPIIAINMGVEGQLSRIQNPFLTPVSHPALPFKAAPGQLSAREIRTALGLHGVIKPKKFYLFGNPVAQSKSPVMHNHLFKLVGLPHQYQRYETDDSKELEKVIRAPDFGGASVTIPLKLPVMELIDEIDDAAKVIGAVNTIFVDSSKPSPGGKNYLKGFNTDWTGMRLVLHNAGAASASSFPTTTINNTSALVIGGGGTARAAIYTLKQMGHSPIYLLARSPAKLQAMIASFPEDYNIHLITDSTSASSITASPTTAIATIPADRPIDPTVLEVLERLLALHGSDEK
ncbi:MAG: hypothetical protein Q9183_006955, partial [Haloplaca sp. 2 TL-2023]